MYSLNKTWSEPFVVTWFSSIIATDYFLTISPMYN